MHSCSFDTTLSFACQESLNVGLFAVKPRHFLLFYCQRKYSVCMCVQVKLLLYVHAVCMLWLFWGWGRCRVCRCIEERVRGMERDNGKACKRLMNSLITVMAAVSLKHLCHTLFLLVQISTKTELTWHHAAELAPNLCQTLMCMLTTDLDIT